MFNNECSKSGSKRSKGVGLWEVLVIAVVVAVMAAVAIPAIAGLGTASSAGSTCQSNLKELGLAMQTYLNDWDCVLPSSAVVSHSSKWNKTDFLKFATKVGNPPPMRGSRQTYCELLYEYMRNRNIVFCPSDPSDHKATDATGSYWYKLAVDKAWYGDGCKRAAREGDFVSPADQIILYEHNSWHASAQKGLVNGAQINVVYLDAHVKSVTLTNATSGDPINCAANADGEPMWFNGSYDTGKCASPGNPAKYLDPRVYVDKM